MKKSFLLVSWSSSMQEPTLKVEDATMALNEVEARKVFEQTRRYKPEMVVIDREDYREKIRKFWFNTLGGK